MRLAGRSSQPAERIDAAPDWRHGHSFNQLKVGIGSMSSAALGVDKVDISTRRVPRPSTSFATQSTVCPRSGSSLGATQNRLKYTINNLDTASENLQAANSRIRDTDMAKMMMEYTKMNVLTQSRAGDARAGQSAAAERAPVAPVICCIPDR